MKKIVCLLALIAIILPASIAHTDGIKCDSLQDAEDYWKHGEKALGADCVETIIKKEPGNVRAHFLKGKYCLANGNLQCAAAKFSSESVSAKYKKEIVGLLQEAFNNQFILGNFQIAATIFAMTPDANGQSACKKFFSEGNAAGPEDSFKYYKMSIFFCGNTNNELIGKRYMDIAQTISIKKRKDWLDRAANFISWDEIHKKFPAPQERTVFEKTFIGQGIGDAYVIKAVEVGKDLQMGDTVRIEGSHFWVGTNGKWSECTVWTELANVQFPNGSGFIPIGAEKGVEMKVVVKRIERYY